jgi:hypothetical protein
LSPLLAFSRRGFASVNETLKANLHIQWRQSDLTCRRFSNFKLWQENSPCNTNCRTDFVEKKQHCLALPFSLKLLPAKI